MTERLSAFCDPATFLRALLACDDPAAAARAAGCAVHLLGAAVGDAAQSGALHAAGARAIAATLARDASPILLVAQAGPSAPAYAEALARELMRYERIFTLVCSAEGGDGVAAVVPGHAQEGLALILILPPLGVNSYWSG